MQSPGKTKDERTFSEILLLHQSRYPRMQLEDVYKLTLQAAMGSEHAASDSFSVREFLMREIESLSTEPINPLFEPLSPDGVIVRVNLRPLMRMDGDLHALVEAFLRTATEFYGNTQTLRLYLDRIIELSAAGLLPFEAAKVQRYLSELEKEGFPAVHHSDEYRTCYKPAYRVVQASFFPL